MKIFYDENGKRGKELNIRNLSEMTTFKNGNAIFSHNKILTEWNTNLTNLKNGSYMFFECTNLASFNSDLKNLTNGHFMFYECTALGKFDSKLPNLTDGSAMFDHTALTTFDSKLPNLTNGSGMFRGCTSLTSFNSDLSKLTNGARMFNGCKLDTASIQNIASTINNLSDDTNDGVNSYWDWGKIVIGIGNSTPNEEESSAFNTMVSKGWTVHVNGSSSSNIWTPTASTNLTDEEEQSSTPIPFYAKPIQVTEENAEYVDANNNYYNIVGAQFIYGDDISTYGTFTSYEHAVEEISLSLGLTPYEKTEEE